MDDNKNKGNGQDHQAKNSKFEIDIEGKLFPWDRETITTEEIIALGELNAGDGIVEIDMKEGTEITLTPHQVINLKPGQGFSKKVKFKRG